MEDLVSIIVPCFNMLWQTKICLEAIDRNIDYPFEVVVVNNNSTDGTLEYLSSVSFTSKFYNGYKVINNTRNEYLAGAINKGVSKSVGKYISIVANDIVIPENMYKFLINKLNEDKLIGAIGPWYSEDSSAFSLNPDKLESVLYFLELVNSKKYTIKDNWHFSVCHILRRDAWDKIGKSGFTVCLFRLKK